MDKTARQLDVSRTSVSGARRSAAGAQAAHACGLRDPVPRFFLYGEPPRESGEGFVHVETIADRSRLYDWKISPHAHRDLHQLLIVTAGGGAMRVESRAAAFGAPALLIVPATLVHAFEFVRDTRGHVASIAESSLRALAAREPGLHAVFGAAAAIGLTGGEAGAAELEEAAELLRRETVWSAPAQALAVEARLAILLVAVARVLRSAPASAGSSRFEVARPRTALVARFRDVLDARFRSGWALARYASELGVSPERLRAACVDVTGKPPMRLVQERLMLEAKRLLSYTHLTIAQTAYELGFADPAYFSRFFSEHAGESPIAFRRRTAGPDG